jgi:purine/pyrimidine-nucleoside phosphorylase
MLKVNEYFSGNVKSISFASLESQATIGVISPGEYEFSTSQTEIMSILTGTLYVSLGSSSFLPYIGGQSFTVPAGQKFKVKAEKDVAYLCRYFD